MDSCGNLLDPGLVAFAEVSVVLVFLSDTSAGVGSRNGGRVEGRRRCENRRRRRRHHCRCRQEQEKLTPLFLSFSFSLSLSLFQPRHTPPSAPRPRVLPLRRLRPRQRPLGAQGAAPPVLGLPLLLLGAHDQGRERLVKDRKKIE